MQLSGYVAHPSHSRGNNRMQYLFLNGRYIRDRSLQHALGEAYRGLLMTRPLPDRLSDPGDAAGAGRRERPSRRSSRSASRTRGRLYSQLLSTLRTKFLSTDLHARVRPAEEDPTGAHDDAHAARLRQELVDWAKGKMASWPQGAGRAAADVRRRRARAAAAPLELTATRPPLGPGRRRAGGRPGLRPIIEPAGESAEAFGPSASPRPDAARAPPGRCRSTIATW